jgi:hypothetical protein
VFSSLRAIEAFGRLRSKITGQQPIGGHGLLARSLFVRAIGGGRRVAHIDLHDLASAPWAGVGHLEAHPQLAVQGVEAARSDHVQAAERVG